ncbi:MAG: sigma 54-interacting transcriptional regulator, partial [Nitrospira sp.]|nr:sigma 54-interacting transcriptional regulator [Nitrospira sp.]
MTKLASDPGPLKAYELVMAFAARRGEAALRLAMHAALPQVLRPELLHLIRLNFLPESTYDLAIEADVLFAPFCEDIGNGYYCFAVNARLQLLQGLDPAYHDESMPRSVQVARFMLDYLDHEERDVRTGSDRLRSDWIAVERWSALAFAEPALAAGQLAAALARATANDDVAARVRVGGLASALATPLARFGELLAYTEGVEALQMGRAEDAHRLLNAIPDREIEVAGVRLKSPRRILAKGMGKKTPGGLATEPAEQSGVADEASGELIAIIGNSPSIRSVVETAKRIANSTTSILFLGESGTGKKLLARSIHQWSHRAAMPFIVINCAALPEKLLENELFGHEQGAFTGAELQQKGKLETADGGTVFLDEIGDMPLPLQVKLLRVLQDREFHRVGGTKTVRANIRIIAASNKDLRQAVRAGKFREDLHYRLTVVTLTLPTLRERSEDIPALAQFFLARHMQNEKRSGLTLSTAALEGLTHYSWPGNIRELEKVILRAVVLCAGDTIEPEILGLPNLSEVEEQSAEQVPTARDQIYISYSHRDEDWCKLLMARLKPAMTGLGLSVWLDREQLTAGQDWESEIHTAIERTCLAIVLVSPAYMDSQVLMQRELPRLVELARLHDLRLAWVCVRSCDWGASPLRAFQALLDPHTSLAELSSKRHDRALAEVVSKVKELLRSHLGKEPKASKPEPSPWKSGGIFIVNRSEDGLHARLLRKSLRERFGDRILIDPEDIHRGKDVLATAQLAIREADVVIVLIGPRWLDSRNPEGFRSIDSQEDKVRIEIAEALRSRITVVPVLLDRADMPRPAMLPDEVKDLSNWQAYKLDDSDWERDFTRLADSLESLSPKVQDVHSDVQAKHQDGMRALRIYLSSTVVDLVEQRGTVVNVLRRIGHHVIGVESNVAADQRPLEKTYTDIAACDVVILLVAWCYGFIPDSTRNPDQRSIVDLECHRARQLGKPVLVFMADETVPWDLRAMDTITGDNKKGERIGIFRRELMSHHTVAMFRSVDELATLVLRAVSVLGQTARDSDAQSFETDKLFEAKRLHMQAEAQAARDPANTEWQRDLSIS